MQRNPRRSIISAMCKDNSKMSPVAHLSSFASSDRAVEAPPTRCDLGGSLFDWSTPNNWLGKNHISPNGSWMVKLKGDVLDSNKWRLTCNNLSQTLPCPSMEDWLKPDPYSFLHISRSKEASQSGLSDGSSSTVTVLCPNCSDLFNLKWFLALLATDWDMSTWS